MSGTIPPLILAMPSLSSDDGEVISLGVNLPVPARAKNAPGVGPGRFEDLLIKEVLPEVDRRYRTIPDGGHRGVDGFSLGGFSAVSLGLRFPDLFSSIGAFEPAVVYTGGRLPNGKPDPYLSEMTVTFGDPPDLALLRQVNPVDLVAAMEPEQVQRLTFHIETTPKGVGDHDRIEAFIQLLARKGAVNTLVPSGMPGAKHGWYWADDHLKRVLIKHAEVFLRAP
jgi:S-formylglutathione hydrolase FrmB